MDIATSDQAERPPEFVSISANDDSFYHDRFREESVRLFGNDVDELESWIVSHNTSEPPLELKGVDELVRCGRNNIRLYLHVIRQGHSWGRLLMSQRSLETLLSYHKVFARFFDVINAFGVKIAEDDKVWEGFHSRRSFHQYDKSLGVQSELCYCIRYAHKTCSNPKKPWSLRQAGIYQQSQGLHLPSTWILVQPPEQLVQQLKSLVSPNGMDPAIVENANPVLHLAVLSATLNNWDEYINHLRNELVCLGDKACFSRVGVDKPNDYTVAFADKQKLQRLRQKLLRTLSVLDSNAAVIQSLKLQYEEREFGASTERYNLVSAELDHYLTHCERCRRAIVTQLEEAHGIDVLLSKILEFRNDKALVQTNQAMQIGLDTLNKISAQSADVAVQSKLDSKTLKLLTLIATMYLPASLLATIFSSNLVQIVHNSTPSDDGTHLEVVAQFWIYIVLTVVLTCATLLPTIILQRNLKTN